MPPSERVSCAPRLPIGEISKPLLFLPHQTPKMIAMVLPHSLNSSMRGQEPSPRLVTIPRAGKPFKILSNSGSPLTMTW